MHRQNADEELFKQCLDRLGIGRSTRQDWDLLITRRVSLSHQNMSSFRDAIHLFPTNELVREYNKNKLTSINLPVAEIEAEHNNATARQGTDALAEGLSRKLYLSVGSRIILGKNICVEKRLVNGSTCFVYDIIYRAGQRPPSLPFVILIQFDKCAGPFLVNQLFPLKPTVSNWKVQSVDCSRKQFPINLAYALTVHKAQGLTIEKATINIGNREAAAGLSYVAFSRVRRLQDLLLTGFDFSRIEDLWQMQQIQKREEFSRNME